MAKSVVERIKPSLLLVVFVIQVGLIFLIWADNLTGGSGEATGFVRSAAPTFPPTQAVILTPPGADALDDEAVPDVVATQPAAFLTATVPLTATLQTTPAPGLTDDQ